MDNFKALARRDAIRRKLLQELIKKGSSDFQGMTAGERAELDRFKRDGVIARNNKTGIYKLTPAGTIFAGKLKI